LRKSGARPAESTSPPELQGDRGMHHASRAFRSVLPVSLAFVSIAAGTDRFVSLHAPVLGLTHVRVIDGTGRSANEDQTLVIDRGRIVAIGRTGTVDVPASAQVLDLTGRTVIPGLVGMHEHLFYELQPPGSRSTVVAAQEVFTKLYLAAGVTTIRTAGTADLQGDLRIKRLVDAGSEPGPTIHITGPYLNAIGTTPDPDAIARRVNIAADLGATSFKAYVTLRSAELKAAIDTAHARGLRVTGHLCAVGYREAAALGIDNLEHGLIFDTEFYSGKQPDECPSQGAVFGELLNMRITDVEIQRTIATLIRHGVAVTSTLAVIESFTGRDGVLDENLLTMLSSRLQNPYRTARAAWSNPNADWPRAWQRLLRMEMQFEVAFVAAGGRLMAGVDPTGWGGVVAGSGDHREMELLVEAGLSPEVAIKVATANGATFLGDSNIGTIETGKRADLVVVRGNPSKQIADLRNVEMVLREGIGYDPTALIAATRGTLGGYDLSQILRWPGNALLTGLLLLLTGRIVWRRSGKMIMQAVSS
jgi:imidazolonepropionase-like amidohydrolase